MDFDFGKYAAFIGPAFAASFVVFAALIADSLWREAKWRREADRLQAQKDAAKAGKSA